ncbi:MAG: 50S ribosomal protein L10 [Kiritimatiellae bacterium]|nr:50S ribosomal protein L10 [Kiritimatiellia bacterium]MDD4736763.1 50S ribosomal protein L10 [Kiritimatiellia bacterium]
MRPEKKAFVNQIRTEVEASDFVILTDFNGLTVAESETLRRQLMDVNARIRIVKNSMFSVVSKELKYEGLEAALAGPTAMVIGSGDVVQAAKVVKEFIKATKKMSLKMGTLSGKTISSDDVQALADIPSREILYGMLVSTLAAPMTQLAGVFQQKLSSIVYVLKAAQEKQEQA